MTAKSKCIAFRPQKKKKKIVKPCDFTEQICLDFTEQAQKKSLTSILSKYPKAQPKRILKKIKKIKKIIKKKTQYKYTSTSIIKW